MTSRELNARRAIIAPSLALALALSAANPAMAQTPPDDDRLTRLERQIELLQNELRAMRAERPAQTAPAQSAPASAPPQAVPAQIGELSGRVEQLEEQIFDLEDRVGSSTVVSAFDALKLNIGGLLTQQFSVVDGDNSTESSFNATQLELFISGEITSQISFFTAIGFLRERDINISDPQNPFFADAAVRVPLIIGWAKYRQNDQFEIQLGRSITPHGIINIEHFPPVLFDLNQPLFLRPFSGATIFPNFIDGAVINGKVFLDDENDKVLAYNAYAGVPSDNSDDVIFGARAELSLNSIGTKIGANYSNGRREGGAAQLANGIVASPASFTPVGEVSVVGNRYNTFGFDVLVDAGRFKWKNELFLSFEEGEENRFAAYTQPIFELDRQGKWAVFYRFDYLDPGQGIPTVTEHLVGVNWKPVPQLRVRANYARQTLAGAVDDSVDLIQLSATFSF